jgi:hypothetical protein
MKTTTWRLGALAAATATAVAVAGIVLSGCGRSTSAHPAAPIAGVDGDPTASAPPPEVGYGEAATPPQSGPPRPDPTVRTDPTIIDDTPSDPVPSPSSGSGGGEYQFDPNKQAIFNAPYVNAPTENLRAVSASMHLRWRSVTAAVSVQPRLNLSAPVDISILFGAQRITQTYNNSSGNRFVSNFDAKDGLKRPENIVVSLLERAANGTNIPHNFTWTVNIEPLFDVSTGPLDLSLVRDCDDIGNSEPIVSWRFPAGDTRRVDLSMSGGQTIRVDSFARAYAEMSVSSNLQEPTFNFVEDDVDIFPTFISYDPPLATVPLLPGRTHTIATRIYASNDHYCSADVSYVIRYQVRSYPNL